MASPRKPAPSQIPLSRPAGYSEARPAHNSAPPLPTALARPPQRNPFARLSPPPAEVVKAEPVEVDADEIDWPWSERSQIVCFFDPFSVKARTLAAQLETNAERLGRVFPRTMSALEATHVLLDPECELNNVLRSGLPGTVVSLAWAKDSHLYQHSAPESSYPLASMKKESDEVELELDCDGPEEDEVEDYDESANPFKDLALLYVTGRPTADGWLVSEEDSLARFLANEPTDVYSAETFQRYAQGLKKRSAAAVAEHYRTRSRYIDRKVTEIRARVEGRPAPRWVSPLDEEDEEGQMGGEHADDASSGGEELYASQTAAAIAAVEESDADFDGDTGDEDELDNTDGASTSMPSSARVNQPYTEPEKQLLIRLLSKTDRSLADVCAAVVRQYPHRTLKAVDQHYRTRRSYYDSRAGRISQSLASSTGALDPGRTRVPYSTAERSALVRLLVKGHSKGKAAKRFCEQFPGRTQHAVENHLHKQKDIYAKLVSETITDVSDSSDDDALLAPAGGRARGPGMAPKWTEAEDAVLVQLLAQSPSKAQAYRDFIKRYPNRTLGATHEHLSSRKQILQPRIAALKREIELGSSKRHRRISEPEPPGPSSKRSRLDDDAAAHRPRHSLPSTSSSSYYHHQNAIASGSGTSSYDRPSARRQLTLSPDPLPYRHSQPVASTHQSLDHAPSPSQASSYAAQPRPLELEPHAFLSLGVPPFGHSPELAFCFFCGHVAGSSSSGAYTSLALAAPNPYHPDEAMRTVAVSAPAREGCERCKSWYDGRLAGEKEGSELERVAVVTRELVQRSLDARAKRVRGE